MTYLQAHRTSRIISNPILVGVIVVTIILLAIRFLAPGFVSSVFTMIARPFWRIEYSITEGALRTPESLLAENADLRRRLDDIEARSGTSAALEIENAELRDLLGRATSSPVAIRSSAAGLRLAAVIMRPPLTRYDELIIDLGSDDGVSTTSTVYSAGLTPIGRPISISSTVSRVQLFSSPGETRQVFIGASKIVATASGRGGGQYLVLIPKGAPVIEGDVVRDSMSDDRPIGSVIKVIADPAQTFESALVAPSSDPLASKWVMVRTDK